VTSEERAIDALAHAQAAAMELIAALRAALDVAEELVRDPAPLLALAATAGEALAPLVEAVAPLVAKGREAAAHMAETRAHGGASGDGPSPRPRVQHIRVS